MMEFLIWTLLLSMHIHTPFEAAIRPIYTCNLKSSLILNKSQYNDFFIDSSHIMNRCIMTVWPIYTLLTHFFIWNYNLTCANGGRIRELRPSKQGFCLISLICFFWQELHSIWKHNQQQVWKSHNFPQSYSHFYMMRQYG